MCLALFPINLLLHNSAVERVYYSEEPGRVSGSKRVSSQPQFLNTIHVFLFSITKGSSPQGGRPWETLPGK